MKKLVNPLNIEPLWKENRSLNNIRKEVYSLSKYYINMENKEMGDFLFQVYLHLCDYRNLLLNLEEHIDKANPHGH